MKVLHYIPGFLYGGIETMYLGWYENIDRDNVTFELLFRTQDDDASAVKKLRELGGVYYRLAPLSNLFAHIKSVRNFFREHHDYDVLHVHELAPLVMTFAKIYGIKKIIIHSHTTKRGDGLKSKFQYYLEQITIRMYAQRAFACSRLAAEWKYGGMTFKGNDVKIIHNAIDTSKYAYDKAKREDYRTKLGIEGNCVIGHVGRLTPQKNQFYLLDIFSSFCQNRPDSVLLLIGDGPDEAALCEYAAGLGITEKVRVMGARSDVPGLMQAMDLFLLPSRWEGLPVTLVEAQASGLPCVISDVISDEADVTDLIFRYSISDSPKQWAEYIERALQQSVRTDRCDDVIAGGYDIKKETADLIAEYMK